MLLIKFCFSCRHLLTRYYAFILFLREKCQIYAYSKYVHIYINSWLQYISLSAKQNMSCKIILDRNLCHETVWYVSLMQGRGYIRRIYICHWSRGGLIGSTPRRLLIWRWGISLVSNCAGECRVTARFISTPSIPQDLQLMRHSPVQEFCWWPCDVTQR